jgi:SAM-dependent methyltransferase
VNNAYDLVRYPDIPFAHTHPIALSVFAALFGKPFTPLSVSRVLEIGCGEGGNLSSMALGAPDAEFVGIDLAEQPIARARATARAAGLANVSFHVQDILSMDVTLGRFDYIIAHGVYAWVPVNVREALMRIVGELLDERGLAMISYNAHPGSRIRQALRDILLDATEGVEDPREKVGLARAALAQQIESWSEADPLEHAMILQARNVLDKPPAVLFHDELGAVFEPRLLRDVVVAAREAGLDYLCDAKPSQSSEAFFPTETCEAARARASGDWARFEQLLDFNVMRSFHNSIFCRPGGIDRRLEARRLRGLWATCELRAAEPSSETPDAFAFRSNDGVDISTNSAKLARVLAGLAAAFPSSVSLDAVAEDPDLAEQVIRLFVAQVIRVTTAPFPLVATPGEFPIANALARFQAARGDTTLATMRHAQIKVDDEAFRMFVTLLDGTRTRTDLANEVFAREAISPDLAAARVTMALAELTRQGLMIG